MSILLTDNPFYKIADEKHAKMLAERALEREDHFVWANGLICFTCMPEKITTFVRKAANYLCNKHHYRISMGDDMDQYL